MSIENLNGWLIEDPDEYMKEISEIKSDMKNHQIETEDNNKSEQKPIIEKKSNKKVQSNNNEKQLTDLIDFIDTSINDLQSIKSDLKSVSMRKDLIGLLSLQKRTLFIPKNRIPNTITGFLQKAIGTNFLEEIKGKTDRYSFTNAMDIIIAYFKYLKKKSLRLEKRKIPVLNNQHFAQYGNTVIENNDLDTIENCIDRLQDIYDNSRQFEFLDPKYPDTIKKIMLQVINELEKNKIYGIKRLSSGKQFSELTRKLNNLNFGFLKTLGNKIDNLTDKLESSHAEFERKKRDNFWLNMLNGNKSGEERIEFFKNWLSNKSYDDRRNEFKQRVNNYKTDEQKFKKDKQLTELLSKDRIFEKLSKFDLDKDEYNDNCKQFLEVMQLAVNNKQINLKDLQEELCYNNDIDPAELLQNSQALVKDYIKNKIKNANKKTLANTIIKLGKLKENEK